MSTSEQRIVKLNVGGQVFLTSRETLSASPFFLGLLEGGIGTATYEGAVFIDRSPQVFARVLELLRTGVLFWNSDAELRAIQIDCNFYLLARHFQEALCPIASGLYTGGGNSGGAANSDSHPWILFVETSFQLCSVSICQVLLTGVVDEEVLLRCPATLSCGGFINVSIRGRILTLSRLSPTEILTSDPRSSSCDRILVKQSDPSNVFPIEELPLKQKLTRTKSKGRTMSMWFDKEIETGEILFWKQKSDGRTSVTNVTVLCSSLFIFSNQRDLGVIYLSGRVPFLIRRRFKKTDADEGGSYVPVIALERERRQRVANII